MFSGLPRRRDNAKVIRLGAVSNITLAGDDPDFIVLEVFNTAFNGTRVMLPNTAPIGKAFNFALVTSLPEAPAVTNQTINIIVPLRKEGGTGVWVLGSGQRPRFVYGPTGWLLDGGHDLPVSGSNARHGISFGAGSIAATGGVAIGFTAQAYDDGLSVGHLSIGYTDGTTFGRSGVGHTSGVAVGYQADGNTSGVAVGKNANGATNGTAVGRLANSNTKDAAVALGYYSKAERYRELVKSADRASTQLQSWSLVNWYGTTTDATPTLLLLGGTAAQRCVLLDNSAFMFVIQGVCGVTGGGTTAGFHIIGTIKRGAGVATTALVGVPTVTNAGTDNTAITLAVSADTTNGALAVTATGVAATTIKWNVTGTLSEMRF
jgi:hypothetical protein